MNNSKSAYNYSAYSTLKLFGEKSSDYWSKKREENSLNLFHRAAEAVPAYKDFLKHNNVRPEKIQTWQDFQTLPSISKKNYLRKYKLEDVVWNGSLQQPLVFTATSGSTGTPVYFVRNQQLDWQYSVILESFLKEGLKDRPGPVLVIVSFGMGLWIGGVITYKAFELAAQRNNMPVSIITPGMNKKEIFNALRELSPQFGQTIISGYPPFLKDIIDEAPLQGIDIDKLNIRMTFAAEAITEQYRDYVAEKTKMKNALRDTLSIYGSADIGAMAYESNVSVLVKRLALGNKELFSDIFNNIQKTPTLAQFNPQYISFEEVNGELLLTGNSAIPLVRYAIGDNGGVFTYKELEEKMKKHGIDFDKELKKAGIDKSISELPFVYVYERIDLSTTFYGLLIFPEWIRESMLRGTARDHLTGKFTMITRYNNKEDQYIEINVELKKGKKENAQLKKELLENIVADLRKHSSEFTEISNQLKKRAWPKIIFWPAEDPTHFAPGIKQKWVKKEE